MSKLRIPWWRPAKVSVFRGLGAKTEELPAICIGPEHGTVGALLIKEAAKEAVNLGAFAYVEKARDPEELVSRVHAAHRWHLNRYAKDLEDAVAERTSELREVNNVLRGAIAQRSRAEEELRSQADLQQIFLDNMPPVAMLLRPQRERSSRATRQGERLEQSPERHVLRPGVTATRDMIESCGFEG